MAKKEFFCYDGLYDGKLNWLHVDGGSSDPMLGFGTGEYIIYIYTHKL